VVNTPKIKHSADNVTYADLITFTDIPGTGRSAQRVVVSGTVNRYLKASWAPTDAGNTAPFFTAFGRY